MDISIDTAQDYITEYLVSKGNVPVDWAVYSAANELVFYMKENRLIKFEEVDSDVLVGILECGVRSW